MVSSSCYCVSISMVKCREITLNLLEGTAKVAHRYDSCDSAVLRI